ncbi:hypothetical protein MOQ72_34215 [Saccharopolyspora sp. K220]|uniref:hypothetical protein n=1 Tax=Saccharopolyspora soli TaxID=2926618 RepID=UPI001F5912C0|nr:hypothetical protein [Saccharopolyspora soli]MCI2422495.1 hypothetical protein [Saccharopolyspora soli]
MFGSVHGVCKGAGEPPMRVEMAPATMTHRGEVLCWNNWLAASSASESGARIQVLPKGTCRGCRLDGFELCNGVIRFHHTSSLKAIRRW